MLTATAWNYMQWQHTWRPHNTRQREERNNLAYFDLKSFLN